MNGKKSPLYHNNFKFVLETQSGKYGMWYDLKCYIDGNFLKILTASYVFYGYVKKYKHKICYTE